jgi:LPXTG-motif cell wall-anchored protein
MVLPAIPGFPWESIIAGIMLAMTALAIVRRRKK